MPKDPDRRPSPLERAVMIVLTTFTTVITRCAAPDGGGDDDERPSAHLQAVCITLGTFAAILTWQLVNQAH